MSRTAAAPALGPSDFFVVLEKAFRKRAKLCNSCAFSLPYRVFPKGDREGRWAVIPSEGCSQNCQLILDDLVDEYQSKYSLSDTGHFYRRGGALTRDRRGRPARSARR